MDTAIAARSPSRRRSIPTRLTSATAPIVKRSLEGVSRQHSGTGRAFRAAERHTQDLYQDGRKRQQAPSRLLRQLRHADLCLCGGQSAELWLAYRGNYTARRLLTEATRLAAFCAALGGCARRCARDRERVARLNRDHFTQPQLRLTPYHQPDIVPPI
jgi:hypothetical protein